MNRLRKGLDYEREVAALFESFDWEVRGLESSGDHLIVASGGLVLASECKRAERLKVPEWWRQTIEDAPASAVPMLTFRQSRQESASLLRTVDVARLLRQ